MSRQGAFGRNDMPSFDTNETALILYARMPIRNEKWCTYIAILKDLNPLSKLHITALWIWTLRMSDISFHKKSLCVLCPSLWNCPVTMLSRFDLRFLNYSLGQFIEVNCGEVFSAAKLGYFVQSNSSNQWCGLTRNEPESLILTFILWSWMILITRPRSLVIPGTYTSDFRFSNTFLLTASQTKR